MLLRSRDIETARFVAPARYTASMSLSYQSFAKDSRVLRLSTMGAQGHQQMITRVRTNPGAPALALGWRIALLTVGLAFCLPLQLQAQGDASSDARLHAQRAELEAAARKAEQEVAQAGSNAGLRSRKQAEASALRERLRDGDFGVGDRIYVEMRGAEQPFADTVTVRAGRTITIGTLPEISLQGVLRSELEPHLKREVARYVREPQVTALSFVRVSVLGAIGKQGFYTFPADILLTDALMQSGGMREDTDVDKIAVRRGDREIISQEEARRAIRDGRTLDQLDIRAGDEITVGKKREFNWGTALRVIGVVSSLAWLTIRLSRR